MKKKRPLKRRFYVQTYCDGEFHCSKEVLVKWKVKEAKENLVKMARDFGGDHYEISTHMYEYSPDADGDFSCVIDVKSKNGEVRKHFIYQMDFYPW